MAASPNRWILFGDSIQSEVFGTVAGTNAPATALTASQIPGLANVVLQNISSPGLRMTDGGDPGFGAFSNKGAIGLVSGFFGAFGLIITLGTNDWANPPTTGGEFTTDYRGVIDYAKSLGMVVVCVSPLWRFDEGAPIAHADATYWLANFRTTIQAIAQQEGVYFVDGTLAPCTSHPELYADGIHLNQDGHAQFAPWLVAQIRALQLW